MSRSQLLLPALISIAAGCTAPSSRAADTVRPAVAAPPSSTSSASVAIAPPAAATTLRYMACGDPGHIVFEVGPQYGAHLASRGAIGLTQTIDGADWELGESQPGDVSQELTYDGRRRTETPQLLAFRRSTTPVLWVSSTGIDNAAQLSVLARLADATPDADPVHHHQIGTYHLHLPWAGAFSGGGFSTADEDYSARFVPYSVWNPDASTRATVGGYTVFVVETQEPLHGEEGGPLVPLWHAETTIGSDLLEVHGRGAGVDRTSFLDATASFIRAADASPSAPCRSRSGSIGS
jgi:hypothetical protein